MNVILWILWISFKLWLLLFLQSLLRRESLSYLAKFLIRDVWTSTASTKYHSNVININSRVNLGFRTRRDSVRLRVWEITLRILSFRKSEPRRSHLTVMNHLRVRSLSVPLPLSACLPARDIKRRYILRRKPSQTLFSRSHINKVSFST